MEVVKASMKTKKNEENIYKIVNAWLKNEKGNKKIQKERERLVGMCLEIR